MKIQVIESSMPYDIGRHISKEFNLNKDQSKYLNNILAENILMVIKIDGKLRQTTWKYYHDFTMAYSSCCGNCNDESLAEVEKARNELLQNSVELTDHAIDY